MGVLKGVKKSQACEIVEMGCSREKITVYGLRSRGCSVDEDEFYIHKDEGSGHIIGCSVDVQRLCSW